MTFAFNLLAAPGASWYCLSAERFEVCADTPPKDLRPAARVLASVTAVYSQLLGPLPARAPAIRLLLFRRDEDFRRYRDNSITRGFFQTGPERDYLVIPASSSDRDRVLRHELVHYFLAHTMAPLPQWLEEGLAEFFSTVDVRQGKMRVGSVVQSHANLLARGDWIEPARFLAIGKRSEEFDQPHQVGLYYAQSWALVHMLQHAPGYRGKMMELTSALAAGGEPDQVFPKLYGRSVNQVFGDLRQYVEGRRFAVRELAAPELPALPDLPVEELSEVDVIALQADLYMASGKPDEARALYARLANLTVDNRLDQASALGFAELREGTLRTAAEHFRRAVEGGSRNASVYFELAMLDRDGHAPDSAVVPLLEKAVALNPAFAEAWYQLGLAQMRQGRPAQAVESLRTATGILPRRSSFWASLALASRQAGYPAAATAAARRAMLAANSETEYRNAEGILAEVEGGDRPAPATSLRPAPVDAAPRNNAAAEGLLKRIECGSGPIAFIVESGGAELRLNAANPNRIRINGRAEKHQFSCGDQRRQPVRVEYFLATGELIAIDYR